MTYVVQVVTLIGKNRRGVISTRKVINAKGKKVMIKI